MNTIEIAKLVDSSTVAIFAYEENEIYSTGSGCIINSQGYVVTADHVITCDKKLDPKEIENGSVKIICKINGKYFEYVPVAWNITFDADYMKKKFKFDLALLRPKNQINDLSHIPISDRPPILGEEILLGGFPEDIDPPMNFDKHIKMEIIKDKKNHKEFETRMIMFNRFLMVKRAIVSKVFGYSVKGNGVNLSGSTFYFDNVMHSGGSGGPIVSSDGKLLGVISKRAVIDLNYEESPKGIIPSGSGRGLTCDTLFQFLEANKFEFS